MPGSPAIVVMVQPDPPPPAHAVWLAAVINPLPLTVSVMQLVELPKVPTLLLTVDNVSAADGAPAVVPSPLPMPVR